MKSTNCKDLSSKRYGRLLVLKPSGRTPYRNVIYECICDCGNITYVSGGSLQSGKVKSCGCYRKDIAKQLGQQSSHPTHNLSNSRLYGVWSSMKRRCNNLNNSRYKNYGAKGISVCEAWNNDFYAFYEWAMQHGYDEGAPKGQCTLDRIDNHKGYSPDNCRWVSCKVQNLNRDCNRYIEYNGKRQTISQWAKELNLKPNTIWCRIASGWSPEQALTIAPSHANRIT